LKLTPHNFKDAEYKRRSYLVDADRGTTIADLTTPEYWVHVAAKLKPRDRVEVHAHDGSWMAELLVVAASRLLATLVLLSEYDLTASATTPALSGDDVEVKYRGPIGKWSAVRLSDKSILVEGLGTRDEVNAFLKNPTQQSLAA